MNKAIRAIAVLCGIFLVMQVLPIGCDHTNPPVSKEPHWDSPRTRELVARACFDCHSNETKWPWYSHVAPVSWVVHHHVVEGREHLNFSQWDRPQKDAHEAVEAVEEGEMPMKPYLMTHSEAVLNAQEKAALIEGLNKSVVGPAKAKGKHKAAEDDH